MSENPNLSMSSGEPDCDSLQALLPAYSIGATDEEETRLVEALLPLCPEIAAELPEYLALSGAILETVAPAMPPAALHDKLMALTAGTAAPDTLVVSTLAPKTNIVRLNRLWISAAAAMLALLIVSNAYWAMTTSQIRQEQLEFLAQLEQQNEIITGLTEGNVVQVSLNASQGNARVFWNTDHHVAFLSTEGLPALSQAETYQLWLINGENRISAGTFQVDESGRGILIFNPALPMDDYERMGITIEPAGGSESPTGDGVAGGEI
jgi:anti-sigma-K factor RskA